MALPKAGRVVLPLVALAAAAAHADVPRTVALQGVLRSGTGALQSGTFTMLFRLYAQPNDVNALWEERLDNVEADGGVFTVRLGMQQDPAGVFQARSDLWVGVTVVGDPSELPRFPLDSVPFAFEALHADDSARLGGVLAGGWQRAFGVSSPLQMSSGNLVLPTCGPAQVLKTRPQGWVCEDDAVGAYAAGQGLELSGNAFRVPDGAVTTSLLAGDAVTGEKILDGTVDGPDVSANVAVLGRAGQAFTAPVRFSSTGTALNVDYGAQFGSLRTGPLTLATGAGFVSLVSPSAGSAVFTLPSADGPAGAALVTNGTGTLSFRRPATYEATTPSFALGAAMAEITAVRTPALTGDFLVMFSAMGNCVTASADADVELRRGATVIAGTQHKVFYISAQHRDVGFQRFVTGLNNETVSAWAIAPVGGVTCTLDYVTLTALER